MFSLLALEDYRGTLEINRERRIHLSKVGEYPLGDWYDGTVTLNRNILTIGGRSGKYWGQSEDEVIVSV